MHPGGVRFAVCLFGAILVSGGYVEAVEKCAQFEFPGLNGLEVTAEKDTDLTLPFRLNVQRCTADLAANFTITINKIVKNPSGSIYSDYCKFVLADGKCTPINHRCICPEGEDGMYRLTKTVDMSDNTSWSWGITEGLADIKKVTFKITERPSVSSLTLSGHPDRFSEPANQGDSVDVLCTWDAGTPQAIARLLDRHGVEMEGSIYSSGQIRYTFPAVGCQDTGLIRCEAERSKKNQTAMLLVKCAPDFENPENEEKKVTVTSGDKGKVEFKVRTHTHVIKSCTMSKIDDEDHQDCNASGVLTGTPPDLTLTAWLDKMRKEDEGQWRLELTNDEGTGHGTFTVEVVENEDEPEENEETDEDANYGDNADHDDDTDHDDDNKDDQEDAEQNPPGQNRQESGPDPANSARCVPIHTEVMLGASVFVSAFIARFANVVEG